LKGEAPLRILHCPWNIAGQSASLASAERELGADSRCIVLQETGRGFPADEFLTRPGDSLVMVGTARYRLLWRAMKWADVVHFNFGQSCLVPHAFPSLTGLTLAHPVAAAMRLYARAVWLKDLPLLGAMGKTLAMTWQGDDARQRDRSLELFDISIAREMGDRYYLPGSDEWKRRAIRSVARHATLLYALNPDLLHVLPSETRHLPYSSFDPRSVSPSAPDPFSSGPLRFAHAPSHRGAKGTSYILSAVSNLRSQGLSFCFDLIENVPREEALKRYATCDVVIDQLLAGWYGGVGVEAMAQGKPVIAYIREGDLVLVAPKMSAELPVISATPSSIEHVLRRVIAMPRRELHDIGKRSRAFVERWDNPLEVAKTTLADYAAARAVPRTGGLVVK
jgi:hypothetical protein